LRQRAHNDDEKRGSANERLHLAHDHTDIQTSTSCVGLFVRGRCVRYN
jgi:hypothetical protein